jgi:uncharacterized protein (UPF0332 family)
MSLTNEDRAALIQVYKDKSCEAINTAEFLIQNNQLSVAADRIYYGIYYMLSAVALKDRFKTSKHEQLIGWFNKTYINTNLIDRKYGKIIQNAFENRMKSDYDVFFKLTREKVEQAFAEMKEVIAEIEKLI